jgi:hypothetical protein
VAKVDRIPPTCHWCPNEASAYQDWDKGWVSVCMPCHLKDCINPDAHGHKPNVAGSEARELGARVEANGG